MKNNVAMILILTLTLLSLCACGAPKSSPVEDFSYEFEDGEAYITGYIGTDLEIVLPSEIEGRPVTTIDSEAFEGYDMKSIYIPEGVLCIEGDAFENCTQLEKISFPKSLVYIDFNRASYVEDINGKRYYDFECYLEESKWYQQQDDNSVLYVNNALIGYKGENTITSLDVKNGTTVISCDAFKYFEDLREVTLPNTVISIGENAFIGTDISDLYIPESVEYIGATDWREPIGGKIVEDFVTIHGKAGSCAESYAEYFGLSFVAE